MRVPFKRVYNSIATGRALVPRLLLSGLLVSSSAMTLVSCGGSADGLDNLLFGFTGELLDRNTSPEESCTTDITVSDTTVELVEAGALGGDVDRSWQSASPGYSDNDTNGGSSWGIKQQEVCIYMVQAFTGTVEIPVSTTAAYASYLTIQKTFPVVEAGNPLPSTLTFTGDGSDGHGDSFRQCFNIAAIDDSPDITSESMSIVLGEITSGDDDAFYTGKDACDVSVSLEDDDGPGVRVSNISNIMEEPGGSGTSSATFSVRLRTAPTSNVTMAINDTADSTNSGNREGSADQSSLTFTNGNFATEQDVTINSVDDLEVDGQKIYTVAVETTSSADPDYNGLNPRDVVVINDDQSVPGYSYVLWDTTSGNTTAGSGGTVTGFATDENNNFGTQYSTFTIALRSRPQSNVTLDWDTSDTSISNLLTSSLTFTPSNWNTPQTVRVEGRSDGADGSSENGNTDYTLSFNVTTTDPTYSTIPKPSFSVRSCDNDNSHLVQPCNFSGSPRGISSNRFSGAETGATSSIWLITQNAPSGTVTVPLTSTDTTEGTVPANVTITSSTYNVMSAGNGNQINMTHVDDTSLDGSQNWTVTTGTSSGGGIVYDTDDIDLTTTDNEQLYYINTTGTTREATGGQTATIDVCLGSNNTQNVQINAACSGDECGSVTPANVTFTPGQVISGSSPTNADCSTDGNRETFTVTGADDAFADGTQSFTITLTVTTTDGTYSGNNPSNQSINNEDNELPGKAVFVLPSITTGEMTAAGVQGADSICTSNRPGYAPSGTYKAMLVSNSSGEVNDRVATTDGSTAAGQTDWVLTADYYYYRCSGSGAANCSDENTRLFKANSAALIPFAMDRYFSTNGSHTFWTGMNVNMTPAVTTDPGEIVGTDPDYRFNCAGWTFEEGPSSPNPDYYGQLWSDAGSGNVNSSESVCTVNQGLICVQQ